MRVLKWLAVPVLYGALVFGCLYLWWHFGPPSPVDPELAAAGLGSVRWLASRTLLSGAGALLITAATVGVLPSITAAEVAWTAVAALVTHWAAEYAWYLLQGPVATNGAELILSALVYAATLSAAALLMRRRRR